MLSKSELKYTLALQKVPNLGDASAKKLLHNVGSAEGIFKEKESNLLKIDGIGAFKLKNLRNTSLFDDAEAELDFIEQEKLSYSYFQDNDYPERLKHCLDGPILFFHNGTIDLEKKKILSIVGTRKITSYGNTFCQKLIQELAMYPKVHKKYVPKVNENGGFISEFWSSDAFDRNNFLKRNRIIAGISEATIVIESAEKGGSLVTADIANSYNREVFAVPGRATDSQSMGCNNLIKTNQARVVTSAADIIYMLGWELDDVKKQAKQTSLFVELTREEKLVFNYLKDKDKELLDVIAIDCNIPTYKLATLLLSLEMKGVIRPLPGKLFQLV